MNWKVVRSELQGVFMLATLMGLGIALLSIPFAACALDGQPSWAIVLNGEGPQIVSVPAAFSEQERRIHTAVMRHDMRPHLVITQSSALFLLTWLGASVGLLLLLVLSSPWTCPHWYRPRLQ